MQNLQSLLLSSNQVNVTIPSWIYSLPSLTDLHLSDNHFSGNIQQFNLDIVITVRGDRFEITKSIVQIHQIDSSSAELSGDRKTIED
ncbi:hypothetical protein H5410_001615 [Solanum commersonii]|uniref:Uncharacterized protein n=1 Tax=Solanum commersonii TaxID=4109 RepID=A0A9J6B035_SOLCO|nr:hypothetical protein H5410_001615 [Solanum commersonii]